MEHTTQQLLKRKWIRPNDKGWEISLGINGLTFKLCEVAWVPTEHRQPIMPFSKIKKIFLQKLTHILEAIHHAPLNLCYDIKPVRTEEGKFYWKILLGDGDAAREK